MKLGYDNWNKFIVTESISNTQDNYSTSTGILILDSENVENNRIIMKCLLLSSLCRPFRIEASISDSFVLFIQTHSSFSQLPVKRKKEQGFLDPLLLLISLSHSFTSFISFLNVR